VRLRQTHGPVRHNTAAPELPPKGHTVYSSAGVHGPVVTRLFPIARTEDIIDGRRGGPRRNAGARAEATGPTTVSPDASSEANTDKNGKAVRFPRKWRDRSDEGEEDTKSNPCFSFRNATINASTILMPISRDSAKIFRNAINPELVGSSRPTAGRCRTEPYRGSHRKNGLPNGRR